MNAVQQAAVQRLPRVRARYAAAHCPARGPAFLAACVREFSQRRADAVVQVPAQPAPFFLAGQDQPFPGALQVLAEQPRVQRAAELPGQIVQQPLLGRA